MKKVKKITIVPEKITYSTMFVVPTWVYLTGYAIVLGAFAVPYLLPFPIVSAEGILGMLIACVIVLITGFAIIFRCVPEYDYKKYPELYTDA